MTEEEFDLRPNRSFTKAKFAQTPTTKSTSLSGKDTKALTKTPTRIPTKTPTRITFKSPIKKAAVDVPKPQWEKQKNRRVKEIDLAKEEKDEYIRLFNYSLINRANIDDNNNSRDDDTDELWEAKYHYESRYENMRSMHTDDTESESHINIKASSSEEECDCYDGPGLGHKECDCVCKHCSNKRLLEY